METLNPVDDFLLAKEAAEKKEAGFLGSLWNAFAGGVKRTPLPPGGFETARAGLARATGEALPSAVAGAAIASLGVGVSKGIGAIRERFRKQKDYKAMLSAAPGLSKRPAGQVQLLYNSLRKLSPTLAADPVTAGSFIDNAMELSGDKAVMPTQTAKLLAEAQKAWTQGKKRPGAIQEAFAPSRWMEGVPGPEGPRFGFTPAGPKGEGFPSPEALRAGMEEMQVPMGGIQRPPTYGGGPSGMSMVGAQTPEQAEAFQQRIGVPKAGPGGPPVVKSIRERPVKFSGPLQPGRVRPVSHWEEESRETKGPEDLF